MPDRFAVTAQALAKLDHGTTAVQQWRAAHAAARAAVAQKPDKRWGRVIAR